MFINFLLLFFLISSNNFASANNVAGAQIQFSKNGLNYVAGLAIEALNQKLNGMTIPDISSMLKFSYHLSNIKIDQFNIPQSSNLINFSPTDKFGIDMTGLSAKVTAHYQVKVKEGFIHVSKSGDVEIEISSTSIAAEVAISSKNGHPFLSPQTCNVNFGEFDIKFHGSLLDDIIDLFKKEIEKHLKPKIESIVCTELENLETNQGNALLESIPLDIGLSGELSGFHVNYALTSNPESSTTSFTIPIEGFIYYNGHNNDAGIPKASNVIHPYSTDKYLCIDFDGDRMLGSAAYAFKVSPLSNFLIDDNLLSKFPKSVQDFFQCTCADKLCIGELIPEIKNDCLPGKSVAIDASAIAFPGFHFNSTGIYINATGTGTFQVVTPKGEKMDLFDLEMDLGLLLESDLKITNWKVTGDIELYEYHFKVLKSAVGPISTNTIQSIIDKALKVIILDLADHYLEQGFPLPSIKDMTITEPTFKFGAELLSFCADFELHA
uniref:BPI1 domain-containing protein n=1 Tax=Parastrongyloides trichosuri TaxID=131310 RepID=A0A0N4Z9G8_PARTI